MMQQDFINRVRSLYNIGRNKLPELRDEDWDEFRRDPPRYYINSADARQAEAIYREVEARQPQLDDADHADAHGPKHDRYVRRAEP